MMNRNADKERKLIEKEIKNQSKKEECFRYLDIILDEEVISSPPGSSILTSLRHDPKHQFNYIVESQPLSGLISWRQKILDININSDNFPVRNFVTRDDVGQLLLLISTQKLVDELTNNETNFENRLSSVRNHVITPIILLVYNYRQYFKNNKKSGNAMDLCRVEEKLTLLHIKGVSDFLTFDAENHNKDVWRNLGRCVFHFARAVAEKASMITSEDSLFSFWAKGDAKNCVKISGGKHDVPIGLHNLWLQYLLQLSPKLGVDKAKAIASVYGSPLDLVAAYANCESPSVGQKLLSDLKIRRGADPLGGYVRIGEEISRRIYLAFTSTNGEEVLGKMK